MFAISYNAIAYLWVAHNCNDMSKAELQALLHEEIENSDEEMLSMMYSMIQEHRYQPDEARVRIVEEERAKYLRGEEGTYSLEEMKIIVKTKQWPDEERIRIVEEERAKYLCGEGESYSWEDVKEMAKTKQRPGRNTN